MKNFLKQVFSTRIGVAIFVSVLSVLMFWGSRFLIRYDSFISNIRNNLLVGVIGGVCIAVFVYAFVKIEVVDK